VVEHNDQMRKLAIITTHPIQYYAPVFKLLHERGVISIKVFYTVGEIALNNYDPGFGKKITWDIPLLDGYLYEWAQNIATNPGSHHFKGIITPGLIGQVNAWKPDAILVIGWAYHGHLKVLRYFKKKIPVLFRGDSILSDEGNRVRSALKYVFLKWVYGHIDRAFYNGTKNKEYFKKYGLKDKQLMFAPHAIDNERFGIKREQEVQALKQGMGLTPTDLLILFAGKLEEKKDPGLLLDAIIALNDPKVHLLFTGSGPLTNKLKSKAASYTNIHFIDFQNQDRMPIMYQACDLFCLPSKGPAETWGLAVNEAMACSKAILVSDKCGCAIDLVQNEKNGAIFKSGSLDDLLLNLKKLTKSKDILTACGKVSNSVIKPFSFLNIAKAIETMATGKPDEAKN
jgi:glycosyltransferase involved in cell wall biosynthesis